MMKHSLKITLFLLSMFFVTQVIGLGITKEYLEVTQFFDPETNELRKELTTKQLPYDIERPEVEASTSYVWIVISILIGTLLLLLIIKFGKMHLWKLWFFIAVFFTMAIAFSAFIPQNIAAILAFIFAVFKVYKPTTIIQNISELFIYGGLAAIFVPIINVFAASMILLLISIYDIIAVNKTKHMITLAKFQTKSKVFAGLMFPYKKVEGKIVDKPDANTKSVRVAVLGGGDIGFPMIFAGAVMKELLLVNTELLSFLKVLIIPLFATIALSYLLFNGQKGKFYPAMPYISAGCFIGYVLIYFFF
ncbi:hypothetical protein ISS07_00610 [Candidatus Woesearchaeota archaeon]|nr:hypothetical protein [Candidatus Woesearchaeota archaeon]